MKYNVMRFYKDFTIPNKMIKKELTLVNAQKYCEGKNTPDTEKEYFIGYIRSSKYDD